MDDFSRATEPQRGHLGTHKDDRRHPHLGFCLPVCVFGFSVRVEMPLPIGGVDRTWLAGRALWVWLNVKGPARRAPDGPLQRGTLVEQVLYGPLHEGGASRVGGQALDAEAEVDGVVGDDARALLERRLGPGPVVGGR